MERATTVLVAGLAAATCLLPSMALASDVVILRCSTGPSGYISVTHWTRSRGVYGDIGYESECAEAISRLFEAGFRLPYPPTLTGSGPNRNEVSFSFVFVADNANHLGRNEDSQAGPGSVRENAQTYSHLQDEISVDGTVRRRARLEKTADSDPVKPPTPESISGLPCAEDRDHSRSADPSCWIPGGQQPTAD